MTHPILTKPLSAPLLGVAAVGLLLVSQPTLLAGSGGFGVSGIAERELVRRQNAIAEADAAVIEGNRLYDEGDYEGAIGEYGRALALYPDAPVVAARRQTAIASYSDASIQLAKQRAENGEYDNARNLLNTVLSEDYDPNNEEAKQLLENLDDPERYNPANSAEHMADVQEVKRLLSLAKGNYDLGNYDEARDTYNQILVIDRYNTAARRQLEKLERRISLHHESSRDHTRAAMIRAVDELWETYVPDSSLGGDGEEFVGEIDGTVATSQKLKQIRLPNISLDEATIQEAVDLLRIQSIQYDTTSVGGDKGVNIVIKEGSSGGDLGDGGAASVANKRITLNLTDVPLEEALKYVTDLGGLRYRVEPFAVVVVPADDTGLELITRVFRVPPTFTSGGGGGDDGADEPADPFADASAADSGGTLIKTRSAKDILNEAGVTFPEGSSAFFDRATSRLILRNTPNNIDLAAQYVETIRRNGQTQIFITTKFVEVTQENTEELGFDWLLGQFNIPGSDRVFSSGGTAGNAASGSVTTTDFPFAVPGSDIPIGGTPVSRGLRFGSDAITNDAIDGLISAQADLVSSTSPGIATIAGVFTDPQFQVVIRALDQKRGVDLMSAPSIVTRSGQRASIQVIREFIYPTEFDPPEIPQSFGDGIGDVGGGIFNPFGGQTASASSFPVTPTTPTTFDMRPTGVTLEVDPTIGPDGYTIDLNLAPEVVEFEGFINYGSPIQSSGTNSLGQPIAVVLTENRIEQPVFSVRKASTAVTIWDGQTVAIGGLIREDVQTVEDKVPILGDLPLIGRLFQTKADNHFKRNLMVFVTATLIDPAGQRINQPTTRTGDGSAPEPDLDFDDPIIDDGLIFSK